MITNKRCYKAPKVLQEAAVLLEFPFVASGEEGGLEDGTPIGTHDQPWGVYADQDYLEYDLDNM